MMNMVHTTGMGPGLGLLWGLHVLSVIAFSTGILFLIVYAIKTFTHAQLKTWAMGLIVIGAVACLFTIGVMGRTWNSYKMTTCDSGGMMGMDADDAKGCKMMGGMNGMMHDDADENGMDMSMNGMTMMLEGKTGDAFDEAFLEMMIPHHQGAIDMAELALKNAGHAELKTMANGIISAQQEEIDQMNGWLSAWGYTE